MQSSRTSNILTRDEQLKKDAKYFQNQFKILERVPKGYAKKIQNIPLNQSMDMCNQLMKIQEEPNSSGKEQSKYLQFENKNVRQSLEINQQRQFSNFKVSQDQDFFNKNTLSTANGTETEELLINRKTAPLGFKKGIMSSNISTIDDH